MKVHAYEVKQILEKKMTFSDFSLSFRVKINRKPDVYQKLFHGFFLMELEDIEAFCESMQKLSTFSDKCTIVCSGSFYSIDKFCPHEGASLENAIISGNRYLICPRHGWKFDLHEGGKEVHNGTTINAIELDEE